MEGFYLPTELSENYEQKQVVHVHTFTLKSILY